MMPFITKLKLLFVFLMSLGYCSNAFTLTRPNLLAQNSMTPPTTNTQHQFLLQNNSPAIRTSLYAKRERDTFIEESEARGNIILAIVMVLVVWSFSIPPELRREHFCFSPKCRVDNTSNLCYDCISFEEFTEKVADYYKGGGGVHFDFSIEEKD
jgi:hypothetical protein